MTISIRFLPSRESPPSLSLLLDLRKQAPSRSLQRPTQPTAPCTLGHAEPTHLLRDLFLLRSPLLLLLRFLLSPLLQVATGHHIDK
jgi:hypothetical protein